MTELHHRYVGEHWVDAPLERVCAFFSDPQNLLMITPAALAPRIVGLKLVAPAGVPAGFDASRFAGAGSEVVISARLLPYLPLRSTVTARIVEYVWGAYFRDVNDSSRLIRHDHRHEFEAARRNGRDGTVVRDTFLYEVGGIPTPHLLHGLVAHPQVRAMFAYRQRRAEALLSSGQ